jgi:hypothetical protein
VTQCHRNASLPPFQIIAYTPGTLFEPTSSPCPAGIPAQEHELLAPIAFGLTGSGAAERIGRGHAAMDTFAKGDGEVFNAGATEWVNGLCS